MFVGPPSKEEIRRREEEKKNALFYSKMDKKTKLIVYTIFIVFLIIGIYFAYKIAKK